MDRKTGEWVTAPMAAGATEDRYRAFIPSPLPPDPPLELSADLLALMEKANRALGRLDGISTILPNTGLFLYQYIRKEALLSSQIEGTQSSFSDLLLFELEEMSGIARDDVREVVNYIAAMKHGIERVLGGFPISLRLFREIHGILLASGRGSKMTPGEFRREQNWIGGPRPSEALFVPTPPDRLMECLDPFEKFLHDDPQPTPILIKAALAHVQFESIHPFRDGNGRLGRLLITLLLCAEDVLSQPILYLSLYFKTHRDEYYDRLQKVRTHGDWEGWLRFFLTGVYETSRQAVDTARSLLGLFEQDRQKIETLGRAAGSVLRLHQLFQGRPILPIIAAADMLKLSQPTIAKSMAHLEQLEIVEETTGKQRYRVYVYSAYLATLSEGAQPIEP